MRVLVIEDHAEVAELVGRALEKDGHVVSIAGTVATADAILAGGAAVDAVVLDLGLPDGDGIVWCKRVRADGIALPILVLTAQSAVATRVAGLDAGADDFLGKPFAIAELRARVRALGRRGHGLLPRGPELRCGGVHLDFSRRRAVVAEREVPLTSREWRIVELLTSHTGRIVPRADIIDALGGEPSPAAEASLEVIIGRIRKKLGASFIRTVRGEGYASDVA